MRWCCPHCGVNLAIADEKMSVSWSFSRCYQCGGFALVRRSEVNIIKVDRAPAGEKVILPEGSEQPMLSREATLNLARYSGSPAEKPVVKPAQRRNTSPGMANPLRPSLSAQADSAGMEMHAGGGSSELPRELRSLRESLRDARPPIGHIESIQERQPPMEELPVAGPDAPAGAMADRRAQSYSPYMNGINGAGLFPEPLPDVPPTAARLRFLPMAIGIASAIAVGSGLYLFLQGQSLLNKTRASHAVAPDRPLAASYTPDRESEEVTPPAASQARPAQLKTTTEAARKPALAAESRAPAPSYSDQVRSQAMAPDRQQQMIQAPTAPQPVQLSTENPPLVVRPKQKNTHLRAGPGMVYPVVGNADTNSRYVVTDWSERWFKVLPQVAPQGDQARNGSGEEPTGWIRTDAVQVLQTPTASD